MAQHRVAAGAGAALLGLTGCSSPAQPVPGPTTTAAQCDAPTIGPLPTWARGGFAPPDQPVTYFLGSSGQIVGVPFGWPLRATRPSGTQNKIL